MVFECVRHRDMFREKMEVLLKDPASRFESFQYDLDAEMEKYKAFAESYSPALPTLSTTLIMRTGKRREFLLRVVRGQCWILNFGTYPFVTSSNPSVSGICTGPGIASNRLGDIVGLVVYEDIPGWQEDISAIRRYEDLPAAAQVYVERIGALVGLPICYTGVGPGSDALIVKD